MFSSSSLLALGAGGVFILSVGILKLRSFVLNIHRKEDASVYRVVKEIHDPEAQNPNIPALYPGPEHIKDAKISLSLPTADDKDPRVFREALRLWCCKCGLSETYKESLTPPAWTRHDKRTFASLSFENLSSESSLGHLTKGWVGSVSNMELTKRLERISSPLLDKAMDILGGSGSSIRKHYSLPPLAQLKEFLLENLRVAARAAKISYGGYDVDNLDDKDKVLLGRFAVEIESDTHPKAAIIGYKLMLPSNITTEGPPLKEKDCSDVSKLSDVDVEIFVIIRGSYFFDKAQLGLTEEKSMEAARHDWIGSNLRFCFSSPTIHDDLPEAISKVHTGFLLRHRRLFPVILQHIKETLTKLSDININLKTVRFALCGHSQGAALATLTAIGLNRHFPDSPMRLFTYSSPAIFSASESDPIGDTCIRHIRFEISNDLVTWTMLGRRHAGDASIMIDGKAASLNCKDAHTAYELVIDRLVKGEFHLIK